MKRCWLNEQAAATFILPANGYCVSIGATHIFETNASQIISVYVKIFNISARN